MKILSSEEVKSLNKDQLLKELKNLNLQANALRYRELKKFKEGNYATSQVYSPQYGAKSYATRRFIGNKSMKLNELRARYKIASNFLQAETKTLEGFINFANKLANTTNINIQDILQDNRSKVFWEVYHRLEEEYVATKIYSATNILNSVSAEMKNIEKVYDFNTVDLDEISDIIMSKLSDSKSQEYEERELERQKQSGTYFSFGKNK